MRDEIRKTFFGEGRSNEIRMTSYPRESDVCDCSHFSESHCDRDGACIYCLCKGFHRSGEKR
jgi:hypothetical protein